MDDFKYMADGIRILRIRDDINSLIENKTFDEQVSTINQLRKIIHEISPFKNEPVDYVEWVKTDNIIANDYNPNKVAPPEMELLEISIINDGYTQPIVAWPHDDVVEVVDGFHRSRVGKESIIVNDRINGYLPTVTIRKQQTGKSERIASTIRHNRARGKHQVDAMSEIVLELKNRNWKNARIAKELGMDEEEILRLCQITGLQDLFRDGDFSRAWEASDSVEDVFIPLTDDLPPEQTEIFRTVNTNDPDRIFHTFDKWECAKAGFYKNTVDGMTKEDCELEYKLLLTNDELFEDALQGVITKWKNSCEHYLTNKAMNRIAWLGQAALTYAKGIPSTFRSGFQLLNIDEQNHANEIALKYLNKWMLNNNREKVTMDQALSYERQVDIY